MDRRRVTFGFAMLVVAGLSAGCTEGSGGAAATETAAAESGTAATSASSPSSSSPAAPPEPVATGSQAEADDVLEGFVDPAATSTAEPSSDAHLTVTDVRVGAHDGYDRVVFEVAGTGTPGWRVRYVPTAVEDPSGKTLDLSGDGTLEVVLTGMGYPFDTGQTEWPAGPITTEGYAQLWEVDMLGTFEGQTQAFVGLKDDGRPYRVFALAEPARVVVDVQH